MSRALQMSSIVGAVALSVFAGGRAGAQQATEPIRITYAAPAACPTSDELLAQVYARTTRARAPMPGEIAHEFAIRIDEDHGRHRGRLEIAATGVAPRQERELSASRCDELIEALAFFIALTIDPEASPAALPRPAPATPSLSAPAQAPPKPSLVPTPPPPAVPAAPAANDGRWTVGLGAGAAIVGSVAPRYLLGTRFSVDVTRSRVGGEPLLSPSLSLAAVSTATGEATSRSGAVALRWQAFSGSLCPVVLELASAFTLRPCAVVELGVLRADGVAIPRATRNFAMWSGVGASLRGDVPLAWGLFAMLEVGASAPLDRPRFDFTSGAVLFDTPAVGLRAALAVSLHL